MTSYAEQMTAELNPEGYNSLVDVFNQACAEHADRPAFSCLQQELSFAELDRLSAQFAAYLQHVLGMRKGERIAVQLPNIHQYPIAVWGAWRAGLVVVNTNPMYTAREQTHQFNDSGATTLIVLADLLPVTLEVLPNTGIENVIVATATEMIDPSTVYQEGEGVAFTQACADGARLAAAKCDLSMSDVAALQYTGGTTGPSKGAMLSHANLYSSVRLSRNSIVLTPPDVAEITIAPLPLYHVFGFTQSVLSVVLNGGLSVLIPDPRNMDFMISSDASLPLHQYGSRQHVAGGTNVPSRF